MFLKTVTNAHLKELANAEALVLDIETTGLTAFAEPLKIGDNTKIGGESYKRYREAHPEHNVTADPSLRARVLAVTIEGEGKALAWDLDAPGVKKRLKELVNACVNGVILCGQNLAFDLTWLRWIAPEARPFGLLDTALLIRTARPGVAQIGVAHRAVKAQDPAVKAACEKLVKQFKGGGSLAGMALALDLPGAADIDKRFQKPANWTVSHLSNAHYDYATGDVTAPLDLARRMLKLPPTCTAGEVFDKAMECPHYANAQAAVIRLVDMHHNGMPFSPEKAKAYQGELYTVIRDAARELLDKIPEMAEHSETLNTLSSSLPASLKEAWAAYAERNGIKMRNDEGEPVIDTKQATLAGAANLEGWAAWKTLQDAKKRYAMCSEYLDIYNPDGPKGMPSIHGLIGVNCATMRTSAQKPNMQNVPRGRMRTLFSPAPGHKIIAADYSQVELRIAAALAKRAVTEAENGETDKGWIRETISAARRGQPIPPDSPVDPAKIDELDARMTAYLNRYKHDLAQAWADMQVVGMPMVAVFERGLDPHLATALGICIRKGIFTLPDGCNTIVDYLASLTADELKADKERFSDERQAAKAVNFGLLYGMQAWKLWRTGVTDYGLTWTEEEAAEARDAWLETYPEVRFWQLWTKLTKKVGRFPLAVRGFGGEITTEERTVWGINTLGGRPCAAESFNKALNYQDQGSGADMILRAINFAPADSEKGWLVDVVHDELVAVAPDEHAEEYTAKLIDAMKRAAEHDLKKYGIPVDVEAGVGVEWDH